MFGLRAVSQTELDKGLQVRALLIHDILGQLLRQQLSEHVGPSAPMHRPTPPATPLSPRVRIVLQKQTKGRESLSAQSVLAGFLGGVRVGEPQVCENLIVFPLLAACSVQEGNHTGESTQPEYLLLDEALAGGQFEVREVDSAGRVNEILVVNKSSRPVLMLDGEILTGAKQNRVLNTSILVGAHERLKVPVSCVEAGRWHPVSQRFTESRHFSYAHLRAQKASQVADNLKASGVFAADQSAIWDEVQRIQMARGAESPTGAINEVYERLEDKLQRYRGAFVALSEQVGVVVFINGQFICLDAFDHPTTLRKLLPKMVGSYAIDALDVSTCEVKQVEIEAVDMILSQIASAEASRYPSPGLGDDVRFHAKGVVGSCLAVDGRVIHLAAFPSTDRSTDRHESPMSSPSRRRARRTRGFEVDLSDLRIT